MSRIEQLISEIEEYIDSCKFQALSNSKILVNKEELEELLVELRLRIPDEIKKYQKIISNQDVIIGEARAQADAILKDATAHTNALVNEHEIMQQVYTQADQVVAQAQAQADQVLAQAQAQAEQLMGQAQSDAQNMVDNAVNDANSIRQSSVRYTDDMLKSLQTIITHSMEGAQGRFDAFMTSMQSSYEIVSSNRNELSAGIVNEQEESLTEA